MQMLSGVTNRARSQICTARESMNGHTQDCNVAIIGAGPYGLAAANYLSSVGVEARVFGEPMSFWAKQMPVGMCLRSNLGASHIADPKQSLTLDEYCRQSGEKISKPIPLNLFVRYGLWYQHQAVPNVEDRQVVKIDLVLQGFKITLAGGEEFKSRRVVVATGISFFAYCPEVFRGIPGALVSHSSGNNDLRKFKGQRVAVIGAGQSALELGVLLQEAEAEVEVIGRKKQLNWVGLHPRLHRLGFISKMMYSDRDVGPAGLSRLVAMPHLFRRFPRPFQDRAAYRAIRPAVAGWLKPRMYDLPVTLGYNVTSATVNGSQLLLKLDDGSHRLVDHALLATGFRVDVSRYPFLSESFLRQLKTHGGYPVLKRGMESSIPGLYFLGKPAAGSFGPLLGFVSGAEFASRELLRSISCN